MEYFDKFSNYDKRSSFQQVRFGHDKPILETELNEIQQIQDNMRTEVVRRHIYSGFTELTKKEFTGEPIIYNPTENGLTLTNKIAIAPFKANILGYTLNGEGNFTYDKHDNYVLVDLGESPKNSEKDSLVYLEVWFEVVKGTDSITKYGYINGDIIGTPAKDSRVGDETSQRLAMFWTIRVANEVDFDKYPEGLGYIDIFNFSHIFARANGQLNKLSNVNISFCEATNDLFRNEEFHNDKNLYVAGRPTYEINSSTLYGKYIYALPMFRIRRRNATQYSLRNFNGSESYNNMVINNNSSVSGDLIAGYRPDRLAYDVIDINDVIDIRKSVSYADYNENSMADKTISQLFDATLQTKEPKKMRRVQIGNTTLPYKHVENASMVVLFNKTIHDTLPGNALSTDNTSIRYEDSVCGMGAVFDGSNYALYDVQNCLNINNGTLDFYFKPNWNGCDEEVYNQIICLKNSSQQPILVLEKKGLQLLLTRVYDYDATKKTIKNGATAYVDLSKTLLKANQNYHFRIAWTDKAMPINGMIYLYLNGRLIAQAETYKTKDIAKWLVIGGDANSTTGFVISDLIGYKKNFEILVLQGSSYGYAKNNFWPMLPKDFVYGDTLLLPGFNGLTNNFGDNGYTQTQVTMELSPDSNISNGKHFKFHVSSDKRIISINKVYNYEDEKLYTYKTNYEVFINGVATNNQAGQPIYYGNEVDITFQTAYASVNKIVVEATIQLNTGCGGQDCPKEILSAGFMAYDDESDNYDYKLNIINEVSFNAEGETPRQIPWLKPRKVNGEVDKAYDISNKVRTQTQCYARLIYYNMSGNGTVKYDIPMQVYGYKVVGVIGCSSIGDIDYVYRTPSEIPDEPEQYITVILKKALLVGETITFTLATEGYSFDYDLNSKTICTNMYQCKNLVFVADGKKSVFTKPCMSNTDEVMHGGILKSVFSALIQQSNGKYKNVYQCYEDSQVFYDEDGEPTDQKRLNTHNITVSGFNTPFITVNIGEILPKGTRIEVPIMTTYQPLQNEILSIWYNYVPYQGVMENTTQYVKRITDWNYFITTLGTGKNNTELIKKNIINNLPGGLVKGYKIDNKDIILSSVYSHMNNTLSNLNKKIVFMKNSVLENKKEFCNLETEYKLYKNCSNYQDGKLQFKNVDFSLFFDECTIPISKYIGAYSVVIADTGEIMVLVIGNFDENATVINHLTGVYGDLYRIEGRPTTVRC